MWCRANGATLRSGHAEGADYAFEVGALEACIAYLPWESFGEDRRLPGVAYPVFEASKMADDLVRKVHPAPERLSGAAWRLHGRNTWQVFGPAFHMPSSCLVCWTPGGTVQGGTATAIRLAQVAGIPVFNMFRWSKQDVIDELEELLED